MPKTNAIGHYTFIFIYVLALFFIGSQIERHHTVPLLLAYGSAFACYVFLLVKNDASRNYFIGGLVARLLLFLSLPSLSDDLYRFIWDGTLTLNGIDPFAELPSAYLHQNIPGLSSELYDQLNSPEYFTIYPPLNQGLFWLAALIGNGDWLLSAAILRLVLLAADIGSFFLLQRLLKHYGKPTGLAMWYWLNPLVILEGVGNVHFEGLVVFFLLLGIYGFLNEKKVVSALGFGLAAATKLLPFIYFPYLFFGGLKHKKAWIAPVAGLIALSTFIPMLKGTLIAGMGDSLGLYFRSFEFNASVYFLVRQIGIWLTGYNQIHVIGPMLSLIALIFILGLSMQGLRRKWELPKTFLLILSAYLLFATTIHPWYTLPLLAFGTLSGYRYPIVWSCFIFLTYAGYTPSGYEPSPYVLLMEYPVVFGVALVELSKQQRIVKFGR